MPPRMIPIAGSATKVERFSAVTSAHVCSMSSARAWGRSLRERETGTVLFARQVSMKCAFAFSLIFLLHVCPFTWELNRC